MVSFQTSGAAAVSSVFSGDGKAGARREGGYRPAVALADRPCVPVSVNGIGIYMSWLGRPYVPTELAEGGEAGLLVLRLCITGGEAAGAGGERQDEETGE